jgi:acyl carrier protein
LDIRVEVLRVLDEVLCLDGRGKDWGLEQPLLGAVPELDSMAVIGVLNLLEERFGFIVEDDDVDGRTFETVGTLVGFIAEKLA